MRNIFIFHGSYGHPGENWFPWLKKELEALGHNVVVPKFPIHSIANDDHRLNEWFEEFEQYKELVNSETIIVAHSRGSVFSYHLLPRFKTKISALFLVGPFIDFFRWKPDYYEEFDSFQAKPYCWNEIKKLSSYIEVFQSTDDVLPVAEGELIANNLHAKLTIVKNAGHFNVATYKKFIKFPLLFEHVKGVL